MSVAAGMRLGHFEILSEIGQGGMGTVYKARDTRLDRLLAIKVIREKSPEFRERFDRQARPGLWSPARRGPNEKGSVPS